MTDNRPSCLGAKLKLRERVLAAVEPAHVLDGFCGLSDAPSARVWATAKSYHGCDQRFEWPDPRRRWVADVHRLLRAIDLSSFNVFDFDAYGSPWTAMSILAARRCWTPGERGAVVITDGSSLKTRMGQMPVGMRHLLGVRNCAPLDSAVERHRDCLAAWVRRVGVVVESSWSATSAAGSKGSARMIYSATVFVGAG